MRLFIVALFAATLALVRLLLHLYLAAGGIQLTNLAIAVAGGVVSTGLSLAEIVRRDRRLAWVSAPTARD